MDRGYAAGGSGALGELIDEHGEAVFADLVQYYGLNLAQALREGSGSSPRQILVLIRQLPPESRTVAQIRGGDAFLGWGTDRYLQAVTVDAIRELTFAFVSANSKKKPMQPEPVPRPEGKKSARPKKQNRFAQMAKMHANNIRQARGVS
jgi:hypothetical protein